MTDIAINHDLLANKQQLSDELYAKIKNTQKIVDDLVKTRDECKEQLTLALLDATKSKNSINKLKTNISKLDTQIDQENATLNQICYEHQDIYYEILDIKSALNITSDDEDDEDDPTLDGFKLRSIEEFCNDPRIINKAMSMIDPALLARIMKGN